MDLLNLIKFDLVGNDIYYQKVCTAIFSIEFDYNYKVLIHDVQQGTILGSVEDLIKDACSNIKMPKTLRETIKNSRLLTIKILKIIDNSKYMGGYDIYKQMLASKYELIEKEKAYSPYGLNDLQHIIRYSYSSESNYARRLLCDLQDQGKIEYTPRVFGHTVKPVYMYDKTTGAYIKSFTTLTDAAAEVGTTVSAISLCCNNRLKSAGGYLWSRLKLNRIMSFQDNRRFNGARPAITLTPEEKQERIKKNLEKYKMQYK